jgi:hypothetical protein
MNHIEFYEKSYAEGLDYEQKALIKQFYTMELDKAKAALIVLNELISLKSQDKSALGFYEKMTALDKDLAKKEEIQF